MSKHNLFTGIRNSDEAFRKAIQSGRLTRNSARNYMYIYTVNGEDSFKHIDTRQFLSSDTTLRFSTTPSATSFSTIWRRGAWYRQGRTVPVRSYYLPIANICWMGLRGKITARPFVLLAYPARARVYGVRVCGIVEEIQSTESADLTGDYKSRNSAANYVT